nr:protein kinase [Deltaproteobacteria bacterium]
MTPCPDLGTLEIDPLPADATAHLAECKACRLVRELIASGPTDDCERFDSLLAARSDGNLGQAGANLLARHLASCAACRHVADTLSPGADSSGDLQTLPSVDPTSYALGLEVARGGMGRILAARDLRVGRPVAVKELLGTSPQLAARFEREARVTARLQHPGIVPIYEIGRWPDGTPFYAMRMVDGHTLREAIEAAPTLTARLTLLPAVLAAAEAVAFAHSQRVIHRDLTPSNILVGAYGETVVIDWGLAKDLSAGLTKDEEEEDPYRRLHGSAHLTGAGAVIGTAAYMPPEQAHGVPVDERADVYALGAILYHLLAGEAPYRSPETRDVLSAVKAGPPRPVAELAPHAPRDLVSIVTKAMARDPNDRYPTARDLTEDFNRFQTGRMVEAHAYSRAERVVRFARRNRAAVTVSALAVIVLGVFATAAITRVFRAGREAREQVTTLLEERGRMELLAGNPLRALAYLDAAHERGADAHSLEFLIARAIREIDALDRDLECGGEVGMLALSPDGTQLAAGCDGTGRIWELSDGRLLTTLGPIPGTAGGFDEIAYSHDGKTIATWDAGRVVRLWNAETGALTATLDHGDGVTFVSFTPDDRRIATTGHDGNANVWSIDGARLRTIAANTGILRHVYGVLTPSSQLLTLTMLGQGRGWNIDTGELLGGFEHGGLVLGGELSTDGLRATTCGADRLAKVWNATTGEHQLTLGGHTDVVWKCVFSPDSKRLLTTSHDGRAVVWDLSTGAQIASVIHGDVVTGALFSPDGSLFATLGVGGRIVVWDAASGAQLSSHDLHGGTEARFSLDGTKLITQRGDGRLRIFRRAAGPLLATFVPDGASRLVGVSGDSSRIAIETADQVTLIDPRDRRTITHERIRAPTAVSGSVVAAAGDGALVVLDATTGTTRLRREQPTRPSSIAIATLCVAAASERGTDVFLLAGGEPARLGPARHVLVSEGCDLALLWNGTEPPVIWDVAARAALVTLRPIGGRPVTPLGFGAADRVVLVENPDPQNVDAARTVSLWNARTGELVANLPDTRLAPTLDPSGRWL